MAPDAWTEASPNYIFPSSTSDATILNQMAVDNACKQLSISWNWKPESVTYLNQFFEVFAAQGQNFFAASGDNGSWPNSAYYFPEEDQYVTAVGGTDLTTNGAGGAWVSETGWSDSGGGHSPDGIGIPSWQSGLNGVNAASTTLRNVPDVAAEGNFDNYTCSLGACAGGWGGTSFAAPRWAGFMALVNQQAVSVGRAPNGGLGFINPTIYSIGEGSNYHSDFHDITSGSNGAYSAGSGYDLVTGWGSPNGQNLINALTAGAPLQTSTPYETNAVVTLFPNSGPPSYITYALTLQDGTAGATIHFQATICNSPYSWDTTSPGETVTFTNDCPSITPYGTMYATAPNYTQSSSISLSF
jgi:subtilase family serine protease